MRWNWTAEESGRVNKHAHGSVCEWWEAHPETGLRWEDMGGVNIDIKKLNFALHRRGLYTPRSREEAIQNEKNRMHATRLRWATQRESRQGGASA